MEMTKCRNCGQPTITARRGNGALVNLDPLLPVFDIEETRDSQVLAERALFAYASHDPVCPKRPDLQRKPAPAERQRVKEAPERQG